MHFWRKLSLAAFFASIITVLQGCSVKEASTAAVVLLALILPSCFGELGDVPDAIGSGSSIITTTITCTLVAGCPVTSLTYDIPTGTKLLHITCRRLTVPVDEGTGTISTAIVGDMTGVELLTKRTHSTAGTLFGWRFIDADTLTNTSTTMAQNDFCHFVALS